MTECSRSNFQLNIYGNLYMVYLVSSVYAYACYISTFMCGCVTTYNNAVLVMLHFKQIYVVFYVWLLICVFFSDES